MKSKLPVFIFIIGMTLPNCFGKPLVKLKSFGESDLLKPAQIIVNGNEIFVLDRGDETIKVFSREGSLIKQIGGKGSGPGEFSFAVQFEMDARYIYVLDTMGRKIHVFQLKDKKFSHFMKLRKSPQGAGSDPAQIIVGKDGSFYVNYSAYVNGTNIIGKFKNDLTPEFSFLKCRNAYKNRKEMISDPKISLKIFLNEGRLVAGNGKIYFVYSLINQVMVFSNQGKFLKEFSLPLPSLENSAKIVHFAGGGGDLERRLNYDIKIREDKLYILSRGENSQSIVFRMGNRGFTEICRVQEALQSFDISENRLYGLVEDQAINVYELNSN